MIILWPDMGHDAIAFSCIVLNFYEKFAFPWNFAQFALNANAWNLEFYFHNFHGSVLIPSEIFSAFSTQQEEVVGRRRLMKIDNLYFSTQFK